MNLLELLIRYRDLVRSEGGEAARSSLKYDECLPDSLLWLIEGCVDKDGDFITGRGGKLYSRDIFPEE